MTKKRMIHSCAIMEDALIDEEPETSSRVSALGTLGESKASTEDVSTQPGEVMLRGQFRGAYSTAMMDELQELASSSSIDEVAYYGRGQTVRRPGYYVLESIRPRHLGRAGGEAHQFTLTMIEKGSKGDSLRACKTRRSQADNEFTPTSSQTLVGIPAAATKPRWFNRGSEEIESASVVSTTTCEHGDVDLYDWAEPSFEDGTLVYALPYEEEGRAAARCWDDLGVTKTDSDGVLRWQRVFDPSHTFEGAAVLDNGRVRLHVDESASSISAERWSGGSWSSVSLGASDWEVFDLDLTSLSPACVRGQLTLENSTDGSLYSLDASLHRGYESVLFSRPENESGGVPLGVIDLLEPVADDSQYDASPENGLIASNEVRR